MDMGGWYGRDNAFRAMTDVQFVAAMGTPGGGRTFVTDRYLRHYNMVALSQVQRGTAFSCIWHAHQLLLIDLTQDTPVYIGLLTRPHMQFVELPVPVLSPCNSYLVASTGAALLVISQRQHCVS